MLPVHWLIWLLSCVVVSLPVVGWTVLRTGNVHAGMQSDHLEVRRRVSPRGPGA